MKQAFLAGVCCLAIFLANCQSFTLSNLVDYASLPYQRFDNLVTKKGYHHLSQENKSGVLYKKYQCQKKQNQASVTEYLSYCTRNNDEFICFETSNNEVFLQLLNELNHSFHTYKHTGGLPALYQKEDLRVTVQKRQEDSTVVYQFFVAHKSLPKAKDIVYAEDLLEISSHEYLINVFGAENVMQDLFYISEKETNRCSILYPNTSREVIFIWKDEQNYCDISFLVIGGHVQTQKTMDFDNQVEQNSWRSRQGIYTGMGLAELNEKNGADFRFYGWQMDYPGAIVPQTKGNINFKNIGCVLSCLNCNGLDNYQTKIINAGDALSDNKKIFVSTMVIMPGKESNKM